MNILEMRKSLGYTQSEFAQRYNIPYRTIQNWESGLRKPPEYIIELLQHKVQEDLVNKKIISLPKYDSQKIDLPKRENYRNWLEWLRAVDEFIDGPVVYALNQALMCQGMFNGYSDEYLVWVYGDDELNRYNGIVVLGNDIDDMYIEENNRLSFTNFNRTINDSFANEDILDMQGITEALSKYYFIHDKSFEGIYVEPKYQKSFKKLAQYAKEYYDNNV